MKLENEVFEKEKTSLINMVLAHPFIKRCQNGEITLEELKIFLTQQGLYSSYFTRYLCALMSNLPSNVEVLALAENLFEELGLDETQKSVPHSVIYSKMLADFSIFLENQKASEETQNLISTMLDFCKNPNPAYGLGAICLGAEALVPALYSAIIDGFLSCGVKIDLIEFFTIHVECDDGHAETIRDIMFDMISKNPENMHIMFSSGRELVEARLKFFDGIENSFSKQKTIAMNV
jgi:pyrroloquinoline-quinone synthase